MSDWNNIDEVANDLDAFLKENPGADAYGILDTMYKEGLDLKSAHEFIQRGGEHSFTEKVRRGLFPKTDKPTSDINRGNLSEKIAEKLNHLNIDLERLIEND